jgi:hypothetical protein
MVNIIQEVEKAQSKRAKTERRLMGNFRKEKRRQLRRFLKDISNHWMEFNKFHKEFRGNMKRLGIGSDFIQLLSIFVR